jgi:hypothetical protein
MGGSSQWVRAIRLAGMKSGAHAGARCEGAVKVSNWRVKRPRSGASRQLTSTARSGGVLVRVEAFGGLTCPPKTDPSAMRVPTGPGWALETLDETDTTHP